jgi:hypothetical protein
MSEYVDSVRAQIAAGDVSSQALVLLFRATEEAEQRRDVPELEETLQLARQIAGAADGTLRSEAERLVALCEEGLERARAGSASANDPSACPGCGRPLPERPVRCRSCGTLLV